MGIGSIWVIGFMIGRVGSGGVGIESERILSNYLMVLKICCCVRQGVGDKQCVTDDGVDVLQHRGWGR